ncbi:MAG: hypothetical protein WCK02_15850 [Bacteroidota bacterium]
MLIFSGYEGQAAYALTKNIAVIGNYNDLGVKRENFSSTNYSVEKHKLGELGAGYYSKNKKGFICEYFFVVGRGFASGSGMVAKTSDSTTSVYTYSNLANYNRFLVQANFGKSYKKFDYAFSPRVFVLNFYHVEDTQIDSFKSLPKNYIWSDYSFTLKYAVFKFLKISGQVGITIPFTGYNAAYYSSNPLNCSFGLILDFNSAKKI